MPQLGEAVTEGTVTKWLKAVGDTVARDEPLFEVSTDKVDSEVPSPADGVLTEILVAEGDTVDVGARLAVIGAAGAEPEVAPSAAPPAPAPEPATAAAPVPAVPVAVPEFAPELPPEPVGDTPVAPLTAEASTAAVSTAGGRGTSNDGAAPVLSPVVRRLLQERGLDAGGIVGTGLGGRITRQDVEAVTGTAAASTPGSPGARQPGSGEPASLAADRTSGAGAVARPTAQAGSAGPAGPATMAEGGTSPHRNAPGTPGTGRDEVVPFTNIRRRTAEHMVRSKAISPHALVVKEADYERVEQVRRLWGERFQQEEGFLLDYLPFAARAAVEALRAFPHLNASVGDDVLVVHHDVNLGIALDLDGEGLIVPVVHHAEELTLRGMARRVHDQATKASSRRLGADDISGGTFSLVDAGPFGTLLTGAIINQPQVAILSIDGVSRKPVAVALPDGSESIAIHSVGLLAATFDHRAVDSTYVAGFLATVAGILAEHDWASEL